MHVCLYNMCIQYIIDSFEGQKEASGPLDLDVVVKTELRSSRRTNSALNHWAIISSTGGSTPNLYHLGLRTAHTEESIDVKTSRRTTG